MIEKLNEVDTIEVLTRPAERDTFNTCQQRVQVPGTFLMGRLYHLGHACKQCGEKVWTWTVDDKNKYWFLMHYQSWRSFPDLQVMDAIGNLFELDLNTDFSGGQPGSYRHYNLTGIYKEIANILYYRCRCCGSKYLMAFLNVFSKSTDPDTVYVEKILHVDFNHDKLKFKKTLLPDVSPYKYMGFLYEYNQEHGNEKKGSTPEEVDRLEQEWGVLFPLAYREIYLIRGLLHGFTIDESNEYNIGEYRNMQTVARGLVLPEHHHLFEDENIFIFSASRENEFFSFFRLDEGDDPTVYYYNQYDGIQKEENSLSEFVKNQHWYQAYLERREED